mgnify:CR=1 FL=1
MNINESFPAAYINAAALNGKSHTVTIDRFEPAAEMPDGTTKPPLHFRDRKAALILNRTNATVLESLHGAETDAWAGKTVELRLENVSFQGSMVDGVRVAPPSGTTAPKAEQPQPDVKKQAKKPEPTWAEEDDVPF